MGELEPHHVHRVAHALEACAVELAELVGVAAALVPEWHEPVESAQGVAPC
jgi:hypothetical protein